MASSAKTEQCNLTGGSPPICTYYDVLQRFSRSYFFPKNGDFLFFRFTVCYIKLKCVYKKCIKIKKSNV